MSRVGLKPLFTAIARPDRFARTPCDFVNGSKTVLLHGASIYATLVASLGGLVLLRWDASVLLKPPCTPPANEG
jgi:hypothetical protein